MLENDPEHECRDRNARDLPLMFVSGIGNNSGLDELTFEEIPPARRQRRDEHKPRWGRRVLAIFLGLLLLLIASVAAYLLFLNHTVNQNVTQENLLPTTGPSLTTEQEQQIAAAGGMNYLIIGTDARPGDSGRSDVMIVAHVPADHSKVYLIHFPRDLGVEIPGHGLTKLNASYAYGGAPLVVESIQNLVGIKIDHVVKTDFVGFQKMTNAVGGVRVWAEEASTSTGNGGQDIQQGWNDLNGEQALGFVRERYQLSEGDISRGRRQQAFIKALMLKATTPEIIANPIKVAGLVDAATSDLVIDQSYSVADMRDEALALRNVRSEDIIFITAPFTGFGTAPDGGSIDIVDTAGMAALGEAIRTDTMQNYQNPTTIP